MKIKKFSILKERIRLFAEYEKISMREIYDKTGISDGTFSNSSGLNEDSLLKFFSYFKDLNANWLLTGCGSMTIENDNYDSHSHKVHTVDEEKYVVGLQKKLILKLESELTELKEEKKPLDSTQDAWVSQG